MTPRGVCFSRAAPFVAGKSAEHEIAHYQPESRIWNPVRPVRPSTLPDPPEKGKFCLAIQARITPCSTGLAHYRCERTHQHLYLLATHDSVTSIMKIGRIQHQLSHGHLVIDKYGAE